jgi:Winged helix DNA-binding domain
VSATVLSPRALNRALLARQLLLHRAELSAHQVIEHLVGMQAQAPNSPYIGLWTRVVGFDFDELADLVRGREVVRVVLMRSTIHLVTASDAQRLRPLLQPMLEQAFKSSTHAKSLGGLDLAPVAAAGRIAVGQQAQTFAELGAELAQQWPGHEPGALAQAVRTYVPLVQVPPRGIWGESGQARHMSIEAWLGTPKEGRGTLEDLVLRYLGAFGPASIADLQVWSGLTRMRKIVDKLAPALVTFRDNDNVELFDLPDAPRPDPDSGAPVRFLPEFDNILIAHADRSRIISEVDRRRIFTVNGILPGTVLVDGVVHATWKITRTRQLATLTVTPLRRLSKRDTDSVMAEGRRLLEVAGGNAASRNTVIDSAC